jgi:hypothetical protein
MLSTGAHTHTHTPCHASVVHRVAHPRAATELWSWWKSVQSCIAPLCTLDMYMHTHLDVRFVVERLVVPFRKLSGGVSGHQAPAIRHPLQRTWGRRHSVNPPLPSPETSTPTPAPPPPPLPYLSHPIPGVPLHS